ncbi:MAG: glycosyl transferase family 1 [Pseudomonadales bacterium]|nr:MAG: glycosyl transferase family 1 [Pseudomonadales bacterium]
MIVMRLLSSLKHDESERGIYQLGHKLVKEGHTSIIIASADSNDKLAKRLEKDGSIYYQLAMYKKSWWALLQTIPLRLLIEKHKPDIIHVHSRTPAWVLFWALKGARLKKKPHIVSTMYGYYPANLYGRALLVNADAIITVSDSVAEHLNQMLSQTNLPQKPNIRIYRGVNTRRYPYRHNPSVFWLRKIFSEFPELEHKKWLVFPTIIGKQYGQEWLIDILGNLQNDFPNIHAIIMDDDKDNGDVEYNEFRQRAFALSLDNRITFIGKNRNDIREWLSAANLVLALANEPESIGLPILKALHLGTPVVGWDKGAYSEILRTLYPQGLIKKNNSHAVCKTIKHQLETAYHPPMSNQFTLKQTITETLKLYEILENNEDVPSHFSELKPQY